MKLGVQVCFKFRVNSSGFGFHEYRFWNVLNKVSSRHGCPSHYCGAHVGSTHLWSPKFMIPTSTRWHVNLPAGLTDSTSTRFQPPKAFTVQQFPLAPLIFLISRYDKKKPFFRSLSLSVVFGFSPRQLQFEWKTTIWRGLGPHFHFPRFAWNENPSCGLIWWQRPEVIGHRQQFPRVKTPDTMMTQIYQGN